GYGNILLANPSRIGLIAKSRKKTDKHDARVLAKMYHRIKKRKTHNIAITAVARKMLTYIHTMLANNLKYQQLQAYKKAS
ncbi:MAG: hypothetical protein ACQESG_06580, partial [Nanobdellota archaeon]